MKTRFYVPSDNYTTGEGYYDEYGNAFVTYYCKKCGLRICVLRNGFPYLSNEESIEISFKYHRKECYGIVYEKM